MRYRVTERIRGLICLTYKLKADSGETCGLVFCGEEERFFFPLGAELDVVDPGTSTCRFTYEGRTCEWTEKGRWVWQ